METLRRFEKFLTFFLRKISMYSKLLAFVIQSRECSFSSPAPPGDLSTQEALGTRIGGFSFTSLRPSLPLLHPRRPWGSRSGREKRRDESFQIRAKEPLGTDSHRAISKNSSGCGSWLVTKNALYYFAQSTNSFSWVLFVSSYTTAIVLITDCLAHAPKKCTESGNFQFDIKSLSDFKILSARKIKTLFQKYKLKLTTGIHTCIGHVLRKY